MIWRPRQSQLVRLHYRASLRAPLDAYPPPPHGRHALVLVAGRGPGPINALVLLRGGERIVVPRGNLVAVEV